MRFRTIPAPIRKGFYRCAASSGSRSLAAIARAVRSAPLRLCASSRLIVDAVSPGGRGAEVVMAEALTALDKAALLVSLQR